MKNNFTLTRYEFNTFVNSGYCGKQDTCNKCKMHKHCLELNEQRNTELTAEEVNEILKANIDNDEENYLNEDDINQMYGYYI